MAAKKKSNGLKIVIHAPANITITVSDAADIPQSRGFAKGGFDRALAEEGFERVSMQAIDPVEQPAPDAGARKARGSRGSAAAESEPVVVEVERPSSDETAFVQIEHENGAISWYLPERASGARALSAPLAKTLSFNIPVADLAPVPAGARAFGGLKKKLLKVFVAPLVKLVGKAAAHFIRKWEEKAKPYYIRSYTPDDYQLDVDPLDAADWTRLAQGRALLFVHGTFSSVDAFHSLDRQTMDELSRRYGGRLFALNHPTMGDSPAENAEWFLDQIPAEVTSLDIDIVCHSRGGLVSREIANQGAPRGVAVNRIVFVGATNAGTSLADKEHVLHFVNRYSTIAKLLPNKLTDSIVDALVLVLKFAAEALLEEMSGLKAMDPDGKYMTKLNSGATKAQELFAIAADFEPAPGTPLFSLTRVADVTMDAIFQRNANDLVVPTAGVYENNAPDFPIPSERRFIFDSGSAVMHTHFFEESETRARLTDWLEPTGTRDLAFARGGELTPSEQIALRPHVVNMHEGALGGGSGSYSTSPADVDEIFKTHIPNWAKTLDGAPLRIVFWAHGGLINEKDGLAIAQKHIAWWKRNKVYPIYFVWETGLFDALGSILSHAGRGSRALGARGITDVSDKLVESLARKLRGDLIWGAMKANAAKASAAGGGAEYVATQLDKFLKATNTPVELHAVGHSAGSIFHSHFLPAAHGKTNKSFKTCQVLAPAITSSEFTTRLIPKVGAGKGIDALTMYSMFDEQERDDNCLTVYRKSLLYLIYHALEPQSKTPILGLEMCVRSDPALRAFFTSQARAVWSVSPTSTGPDATTSTTHGGFDDDGPTMTSVAMRVVGGPNVVPYTGTGRRGLSWPISPELRGMIPTLVAAPAAIGAAVITASKTGGPGAPPPRITPTGRRSALCVGIDAYPDPNDRLHGCVADARAWETTFTTQLGFQSVTRLVNGDATRKAILTQLRQLVTSAAPGDVVAFQYAGHGTSVPDDDGDERDGTDEALVPVDYAGGEFVTDDDLRDILMLVKDGVSLTCFMDCCHSGTITRVLGRSSGAAFGRGKPRFLFLERDHKAVKAHLAKREVERRDGRSRAFVDRTTLKWVNFSACDATELAYESNGQGAFTKHSTDILKRGVTALTNGRFQTQVIEAFGSPRAQTPQLDCPPGAEDWPVLLFGQAGAAGREAGIDRDRRSAQRRTTASQPQMYDRRGDGEGRRESDHPEKLRNAADYLENLADELEHS